MEIIDIKRMSYETRLMHYESEKRDVLRKADEKDMENIDKVWRALRKKWKI